MSSNREIPQRVIFVSQDASADRTVTAPVTDSGQYFKYFDSVTPQLGGGDIDFYGGGIFEYVDIDSQSAANVVKYINPDTGEPFPGVVDGSDADLADGKAAGWYEKVESEPVTIEAAAGLTVYGRFTKIKVPSGADIGDVTITYG